MPKKAQEEMLVGSLPKGAQEHIMENKISLKRPHRRKNKIKYKKGVPQMLARNEGFDLLENMLIVRPYMCKKHNITLHFLEILLYLYSKDYFTWYDYFEMPKYFTYNKLTKMQEIGMVRVASKAMTKKKSLYCLSTKAKLIVTDFYKYLSGEKKIPITTNPLTHKDASALDKMRFALIKKLNTTEVPESKKSLFQ